MPTCTAREFVDRFDGHNWVAIECALENGHEVRNLWDQRDATVFLEIVQPNSDRRGFSGQVECRVAGRAIARFDLNSKEDASTTTDRRVRLLLFRARDGKPPRDILNDICSAIGPLEIRYREEFGEVVDLSIPLDSFAAAKSTTSARDF